MKQIEISYRSKVNELDKLNARLERATKSLEKKTIKAQKFGVADWTADQWRAWIATVETNENGWIISNDDIKKNGAYRDLWSAQRDVEEITEEIAKAEVRLQKAEEQLEAHYKAIESIEDMKKKEELFKLEFEQEQKEWARDGITLEGRYFGITPQGKKFWVVGNSGWTERSRHCFTLTIGGQTIFTSGEFWRAYSYIKNN